MFSSLCLRLCLCLCLCFVSSNKKSLKNLKSNINRNKKVAKKAEESGTGSILKAQAHHHPDAAVGEAVAVLHCDVRLEALQDHVAVDVGLAVLRKV